MLKSVEIFWSGGGAGMWLTLIFGLTALAFASAQVIKPNGRWMPLVVGVGVATLLAGCLGTAVGIRTVLVALPQVDPADRTVVPIAGGSEVIANLILALSLGVVVTLTAAIAGVRRHRVEPGLQAAAQGEPTRV